MSVKMQAGLWGWATQDETKRTHTPAGRLPVYGNILSTGRDHVRVPCTAADLDVLIVHFGLFTIYVTILGLLTDGQSVVISQSGGREGRARPPGLTGRTNRDIVGTVERTAEGDRGWKEGVKVRCMR